MKSFKDKVVVITGAGSGIGRALAIACSQLGAKLAINDYNESTLLETADLAGGRENVFYRVFDVADKNSFYDFAEQVVAHYGRVDVVINNAGVVIFSLGAGEISIADYEWILGINLWGMIYGSLAFLPHLRKQKESAIVNLSSVFGIRGVPFQAPYCTTKFAIRGFTESLALEEELNRTGVTVTSVHPGGIKTNIARNSRYAEKYTGDVDEFEKNFRTSPEKAASVIVDGIRRKKKRILVGVDGKFIFFLSRLSPYLTGRLFMRTGKKQ